MTVKIKNTIRVNLRHDLVWQILKNFGDLEKYAPTIKSSPILSKSSSGLGATRKCIFHNDSSMTEEIADYKEGWGYKIKITEHTMPFVRDNYEEIYVERINDTVSEITMAVNFDMSGPLGWMMGTFMLKPMMNSVTKKIITGLAYYVKTGSEVTTDLPDKAHLGFIL